MILRFDDYFEEDVRLHAETAVGFLKEVIALGGVAYVGCQQGGGSSAVLAMAYLMSQGESLLVAYGHIALRRNIELNFGFLAQLSHNEVQLTGKRSITLLQYWFLTVRLEHCRTVGVPQASVDTVAEEWRALAWGQEPETLLGRLVRSLRDVCRHTQASSPEARALLLQMEPAAESQRLSFVEEVR
jgi:hypothetical protein